jgi:hypothetical protein
MCGVTDYIWSEEDLAEQWKESVVVCAITTSGVKEAGVD